MTLVNSFTHDSSGREMRSELTVFTQPSREQVYAVVGKLLAKSTEVTATGTFQKKYRSYRYRYFFKKVTCNFEVTSYYKQSAICNHKLAE